MIIKRIIFRGISWLNYRKYYPHPDRFSTVNDTNRYAGGALRFTI